MALIATHTIGVNGTPPTFAAAASGDTAETGSRVFLVVKNGDASSKTVTIAGQGVLESGADYPDKAYTVTAGSEAWIPLLSVYRDVDGQAAISYSATTSVTRAVVEI